LVYPTEGEARIRGRVTSLLEVGTGFRPNLTGRENIFLNASLHGLHRSEIDEIFDNIVEFSGVKKFIDTPVKYYSTGMYSRLAFAVAAHLDPDILLLDEVLAVGDMAFQEKCLKRVGDLTSEGRTILFVSHSMGNIIRFCDKTIWLEEGRVVEFGDSKSVVDSYSKSVTKLKSSYHADTQVNIEILESKNEHLLLGSPGAELISFEIKDIDENPKTVFFRNETIKIYIKFRVLKENINFVPCFHLYKDGVHVFSSNFDEVINLSKLSLCSVTTAIPPYHLNTGNYQFSLEIVSPTRPIFRHVSLEHVLSCKIVEEYDPQRIFSGEYRGVVRPRLLWALSIEETRIE
jgi:lipopolysaccharide transport system ATP-binding protein